MKALRRSVFPILPACLIPFAACARMLVDNDPELAAIDGFRKANPDWVETATGFYLLLGDGLCPGFLISALLMAVLLWRNRSDSRLWRIIAIASLATYSVLIVLLAFLDGAYWAFLFAFSSTNYTNTLLIVASVGITSICILCFFVPALKPGQWMGYAMAAIAATLYVLLSDHLLWQTLFDHYSATIAAITLNKGGYDLAWAMGRLKPEFARLVIYLALVAGTLAGGIGALVLSRALKRPYLNLVAAGALMASLLLQSFGFVFNFVTPLRLYWWM